MYNHSYEALQNKRIRWAGYQRLVNQNYPLNFDNLVVGLNGQIAGDGQDEQGNYQLFGQATQHGTVNFTKQYMGGSAFTYSGIVNNGVIKGQYKSSSMFGQFEVTMDKIEWNGNYVLGYQRYELSFDMHIDSNGIFGLDKDSQGAFVIRGMYDSSTCQLLFTRQYFQGRIEYFTGQMTNNGQYWVVRGQCQPAGGMSGQFEMYRPAPDEAKFQMMQQQFNMSWNPPPVQINAVQPMIMQPGQIIQQPVIVQQPVQQVIAQPQVIMQQPQYPQQQQVIQQPIQQEYQEEEEGQYISEMYLLDGETEDVEKVVKLLQQGKVIQGPLVADFIKRVTQPQDLLIFLKAARTRVVEYEENDLLNSVRDCEHHRLRVEVVEYLADSVTGRIDHLTKLNILKLIGDSEHRDRVTAKLKI